MQSPLLLPNLPILHHIRHLPKAKLGRQQLDLDFCKQALQCIEAPRRPSKQTGVTTSSPKSRR